MGVATIMEARDIVLVALGAHKAEVVLRAATGPVRDEIVATFDDLEACRIRGELGRESLEAHRGSVDATQALIEEVCRRRVVDAD